MSDLRRSYVFSSFPLPREVPPLSTDAREGEAEGGRGSSLFVEWERREKGSILSFTWTIFSRLRRRESSRDLSIFSFLCLMECKMVEGGFDTCCRSFSEFTPSFLGDDPRVRGVPHPF